MAFSFKSLGIFTMRFLGFFLLQELENKTVYPEEIRISYQTEILLCKSLHESVNQIFVEISHPQLKEYNLNMEKITSF